MDPHYYTRFDDLFKNTHQKVINELKLDLSEKDYEQLYDTVFDNLLNIHKAILHANRPK